MDDRGKDLVLLSAFEEPLEPAIRNVHLRRGDAHRIVLTVFHMGAGLRHCVRARKFQNLVLPPLGQVQGIALIAPVLILFRVAQGRAWSNKTVQKINWGPSTSDGSFITRSAGGTATALSNLTTSKPTTVRVSSSTAKITDNTQMSRWDPSSQIGTESPLVV
ncbi:hypothetical protein BDZ89DRAFT_1078865 [Hymenopellis radicata]|nr:hypothetical protein BDZ89DRAFT_1078865 [Hymenopellis radicata]